MSKQLNVLVEMKKQGFSSYTIKFTSKALRRISQFACLDDPEAVKNWVMFFDVNPSYKKNLCFAYGRYARFYGLEWISPRFKICNKLPKIPSNMRLEKLISAASPTLAVKLCLSKETGLRPIEVCRLKVRDIDLDKKMVYPESAKGGSARVLKTTQRTADMIKAHIYKRKLGVNDNLFNGSSECYGKGYRIMRNRLAEKIQDLALKKIRLYDFRHFFATTFYHKTRDLLLTKQKMGHHKIETTLMYTQLIDMEGDEYVCGTAENVKQSLKLIEDGFEYVTEIDGVKLFRKRK